MIEVIEFHEIGEIMIATLDLLLGLPLAFMLAIALRPGAAPKDLVTWLTMVTPWIILATGLVSSGLLLVMRQRRLARAFQFFQ